MNIEDYTLGIPVFMLVYIFLVIVTICWFLYVFWQQNKKDVERGRELAERRRVQDREWREQYELARWLRMREFLMMNNNHDLQLYLLRINETYAIRQHMGQKFFRVYSPKVDWKKEGF